MVQSLVENKYKGEDKELLLYLVEKVIMNDPTRGCVIKGSQSDWDGLPPNKSLFHAKRGCGIPIGNLTSQVFANYYLTGFDRFVKEVLKVRCYGRYVDDFYLVHRDVSFLRRSVEVIRSYLWETLAVRLHPRKLYLQPCRQGVLYLGAYITPWGIFPSLRLRRQFHIILSQHTIDVVSVPTIEEKFQLQSGYNSYFGLHHHYYVYRDFLKITRLPLLAAVLGDNAVTR